MAELAKYFLLLGCLGFGGPMAVIGILRQDLVEKKKWIDDQEFANVLALIKSMPGPVAFQMVCYMGVRKLGRVGGAIAGILFMLPAFLLILAIAVLEKATTNFSHLQPLFVGFESAALALIALSIIPLAKPYLKETKFWFFSILSLVLVRFMPEPFVIIGCGLLSIAIDQRKLFDLGTLFWICFKAGAFVFGTGLAIVPFLENDFVQKYAWLTHEEFARAIAYGQITPGPVVISATYMGFKTHSYIGALIATFAIFLPSAVHMLTWFPGFYRKHGQSRILQKFAQGAISAVVGMLVLYVAKAVMAETQFRLIISAICAIILYIFPIPAWLIIPLSGLMSLGIQTLN